MRLRRIEEEFGERVQIEWRSFLLRPEPVEGRTLEKFRAYTQSWLRPAAAAVSNEAFQRLHERLLQAYFTENRDITERETLRALWQEAELPEEAFARIDEPAFLREVLDQHREALECGVTGVPAVRMEGIDSAIVGAHPIDLYRRWVSRNLEN